MNEKKRSAVLSAIESLEVSKLASMNQKVREEKIIQQVAADTKLTVSVRFVRDRFNEARRQHAAK